MKKLLSICFLSMLLGLLSFSVSAQNDNGCKSGFWIENLQPDTVYGVVNMPPDGKLPLVHTLGHFLEGSTVLPGNVTSATLNQTELYELHFCNTCGLGPKTKVSLDWVLLRKNENGEWVEVNDHLSNYAEFGIYTFYNRINQSGECQSIRWLGGQVFDGFGYCEDQGFATGNALLDTMMGVYCPVDAPTNYPGAMHVDQGYPMAVLSQLGQIVPAAGQVNVYSQNHDYFYLDFFEQTRNIVVIKWKQVGDYKLVMRVRQRLGGTPWTNEPWKLNPDGTTYSETDYVGGHMSCCGPVLVEDTIYRPDFGEDMKEVCADANEEVPFTYGNPLYTFTETMPDTNVVFGDTVGVGTDCAYFNVDSVNRFHFFVRENPQVQTQDITICKCTTFGQEELNALVTLADTANKGVIGVRLEWAASADATLWSPMTPNPPTAVGVYHYFVRQVNIYQTIECAGDPAEITLTINELPAPTGGSYDICNESEETTMTLTVSRAADVNHCSTTSVWFLGSDSVNTGDSYNVTLADIRPETNVDKVVTYHVYAYNATTNCYSAEYSIVTLTFHQTPEIQLSYLETICPHPDTVTFTMLVTSTQTEFPYTVEQTSDFDADFISQLLSPNNQQVTNYHKPYTKITDFECGGVYHLNYKVTDANGCYVEATATFVANDTVAPVVDPDTLRMTLNQCDFTLTRPDTIKTLEGFEGIAEIYDPECAEIANFTCKDSTYVVDSCENVLVRTYTFYDNCENASTLTQIFTAHDSTAPYFVNTPNRPIYERLQPKRDTNCTFNSLSKEEFVMAFLGKVKDNCAEYDFDFLMEHSQFYWEESSQFGHVEAYNTKDIFKDLVGNQLTVEVVVWDDCGNQADTLAFWFEPDSLIVGTPIATPNICLGDTAYLTFDSNTVDFGNHFDVAHPLTFQWGSMEAAEIINFDNTDSVNTYVVPTEGGVYHVNITVTDFYGCSTTSEYAEIDVHAAPDIVIIPHENNVCQPGYTYIPGQHLIWHGSYSPNVGIVWLAARDAADPTQTIPNLTYQWTTSQSVNILSTQDTTGLWIVPDSCTYIYDAQVMVTDLYGCTAVDSIWVPVKDTAPEYIGGVHHDMRELEEGCKMHVGDFTHYVTGNLSYFCGIWPPKKIWQVPADTAELTMDTDVTVYVVSQCGEDTLVIGNGTFRALVYPDRIKVDATVVPNAACSPATFTFDATSQLAVGPVTYKWTKGSTVMSNNQSFTNVETVEEGASTSVYVYQVEAVDSVGCKSTDTVHVHVYETLPIPEYEVFPNTRCAELYNGIIRLKNMPKGYSYKLYYDEDQLNLIDSIITQIPAWDDSVPTTSIIFDELPGDHTYWVLIITDFGCETYFDVYVPDARENPTFNGEVTTVTPTFCTNDNGSIVINYENGFTYYVFNSDNEEVVAPYTNLLSGDYTVIKVDNLTACDTDTVVTINPSAAQLSFTVTVTNNSLCGNEVFNGALTFNKTGIYYVITSIATGDTLYTGLAGMLDSLAAGKYQIHGIDLATGCERTYVKQVNNNTTVPDFNVTPHDNQYCENEEGLVNGSVSVSPAATYTYEYYVQYEDAWVEVTDPAHLAAGQYMIVATDANNCTADTVINIVDNTVIPEIADSTVVNTICDTAVAPGHSYNGKVILTITNYDPTMDYTVILEDVDTVYHASAVTEFTGLNDGAYSYKVIDNFMCVAENEVEVDTLELPELILKQTPNTYCVGTFNKPGNGTITVMNPYDSVQYYYYSYFYAPEGLKEKGDDVEVDYDNLINRFYWLVDTCYYVEVIDLRTGCVIADTITVELARDSVLLTGDPTPNKNCIEPFDGTIQLHASFIPAEFDYSHLPLEPVNIPEVLYPRNRSYKFSIDGGLTYQTDSLFVNLKDSVYHFYVYDTISGCVYDGFDSIVVEKLENDIVIVDSVTPNRACDSTKYDGSITVTASSMMFNPAEFEYSINGGEFSAVNTWDSLAPGSYRITAREINSGCENSINVDINTLNECTPDIDVDLRKYCLNEENATITATAVYPEDSECEGDFTYRWHKQCHNEYFDGPTAPVATDQEMCCFYTVTATNVLTGCEAVRTVEVCVYGAHTIQYTVDYEPIEGNSTTVCENEDLTIGVVHNGWAQAWWTMNHVTDTTLINPEYEFYVNTPDSVAAYKDSVNLWKFNKNISFCLDVIDTNGCHAQGLFNLVIHPIVRDTVEETVCELPIDYLEFLQQLPANPTNGDDVFVVGTPDIYGYDIDPELWSAIVAGTVEYPYSVSRVDTIPAVEEGCDTILTTVLTVVGYPTITGAPDDFYCEDVTIGEVIGNINITNADEESIVITLNGLEVDEDYVIKYNPDGYWLNIYCYSYADDQTQYRCDASVDYDFSVGKKPDVEGFNVDPQCAGWEVEIDVPEYECNSVKGCTVDVIMVDSTDADNVIVTVLEENYEYDSYLLDPVKLSYNGKYIGFKVANECDDTTVLAKLIVDTVPVGIIDTNAICANQPFDSLASVIVTNSADLLNPEGVSIYMYVKKANDPEFTPVDGSQLVDYSYDGAEMYAVLVGANQCGEYTTDTVNIKVSDKPTVVLGPDPLNTCKKDFDEYFDTYYCGGTGTGEPMILQPGSPMPGDASAYVLPNGSEITEHGWLLLVENEDDEISYQPVTVAQIKELAYDSLIYIKYFATNACGSDTVGPFEISITDEPELTVTTGTICPASSIADVITYTVDWHSDEGTVRYVAVKEGEDDYEISAATAAYLTFDDIIGYNGGEILVIAENNCGADTEHVALNIPTFDYTEPVFQSACVGSPLSAFIATTPTATITVATIVSEGWYVLNEDGSEEAITLETVVNEPIQVFYKWVNSCDSVFRTDAQELQLLTVPTVSIEDITICEGSTIDLAEANLTITADETTPYDASSITWTVNGEPYDENATYTENATLTVTIQATCDPVTATAQIIVNPAPVVEVTGDDVCAGAEATFTATEGFASYTFTLDDEAPVTQTENIFTHVLDADETLTSFHTVTVSVVNENGCASAAEASVTVKATGAPQFVFKTMDGTETHEFTADNTFQTFQYKWMVGGECNEEDLLVYVEYDIYYNDEILFMNNIDSFFCIQDVTNSIYQTSNVQWNTSNEFYYLDNNGIQQYDISYYLGAKPSTPVEMSLYNQYGNHFPFSTIVHGHFTTSNYYDDLWMHFLRNREITQTVAPFKRPGDYKFVFRLYQTDRPNNYQNSHTDTTGTISPDGYTYGTYPAPAIGGGGFYGDISGNPATLTLLAIDSITITYTGLEIDTCNLPVTAPALAPDVTVDASKIAPDMEVWPNPAPAITTTLKARVHNMSGEATVTLTNLSGKQLYADKINIDSDNYYFEFGVNNLSVGTYVMTVRTGDAIITKKVVVSALAQ